MITPEWFAKVQHFLSYSKKKNHHHGDSFLNSKKSVLKTQAYIMIKLPDIFCLPHPS